jgi:hypothetical protein
MIARVGAPRRALYPRYRMLWLPRGRVLRVWVTGVIVVAVWFPIVKASTQPHTMARVALLVIGLIGVIVLIATVVAMAIKGGDS